jgi:hypothetical protein
MERISAMPEGFNPAVLPSAPIANPEQGVAFVDGQFIPATDATVSVFDFGFTRSDVTYDVVHVFDNKFFRLNHHLDRFEASIKQYEAETKRIQATAAAMTPEQISEIVMGTIHAAISTGDLVGNMPDRGELGGDEMPQGMPQ